MLEIPLIYLITELACVENVHWILNALLEDHSYTLWQCMSNNTNHNSLQCVELLNVSTSSYAWSWIFTDYQLF